MALLLCLFVASPAPASADVTVDYDPQSNDTGSNIRVEGDGAADDITITQSGNFQIALEAGEIDTNTSQPDECTDNGANVTCPIVQSISIDLAGGADEVTTVGVSTPLLMAGGPDGDVLRGGSASDVLAGGPGTDTLVGAGGRDEYFGEGDGDTIQARDGNAERISCGAGDDLVNNDFTDIIAECERGTDNDGDGFSAAVDCNDANAGVFPGAPDVLENGVDEDCDGEDDRNLDRDNDGFPIPADCNDGNSKIRPGAREIRGNQIDENCDRRAQPFRLLRALVSAGWRLAPSHTELLTLFIRNAPRGARVVVRCKGPGCEFRKAKRRRVRRDLAPVRLHPLFGRGRLRPGARVTVTVTATETIGRTYSYRIIDGAVPALGIRCRAPGARRSRPC